MATRLELTRSVLDRLEGTEWNLDQALGQWWANVRATGGLRLSATGYGVFRDLAQIPHYEFEVNHNLLTAGNLILLDRQMACAYSLTRSRGQANPTITLFDSQEAVLLTLYGDVAQWLQNLKLQQDT